LIGMTSTTTTSPIISTAPLSFPWPVIDPFIMVVHHVDRFPAGNGRLGPATQEGNLGDDMAAMGNGWHMYYGSDVPGFPAHPHRGFETVTFVRQGLVDHADSFGASGRYGRGDVQWLTAGGGIQHSEMFPLVDTEGENTLELFQIWLNLPASDKTTDPHFTMSWAEDIPHLVTTDDAGRSTEVTVVAGAPLGVSAPTPPPASWAARPDAGVAIWHIRLDAHAEWTLPRADTPDVRRMLYVIEGDTLRIADAELTNRVAVYVDPTVDVPITAGAKPVSMLLLQGRPIGEPVAAHGPFVMNTRKEILDAYTDFRATEFGGWPWPDSAPNHGPDSERFARYPDGNVSVPPTGTGAARRDDEVTPTSA